MQFEKLRNKGAVFFVAVPLGAFALTGCGPNHSGNGNEFVVHGRVTDAGKHSLKADILEIDEAEGTASGWFEHGLNHQLHDNCNCHGFLNSNKQYGTVYDFEGQEIEPPRVDVGTCVRFEGKIRADQEGKYSHDRPVYDVATEEDCETVTS